MRILALLFLCISMSTGASQADTYLCQIKPKYGRVTISPELAISFSDDSNAAAVLDGVLHTGVGESAVGNVTRKSNQTRITWMASLPYRSDRGKSKKEFTYRATIWPDGKILLTGQVGQMGIGDYVRSTGHCETTTRSLNEIGTFGQRLDRPLRK